MKPILLWQLLQICVVAPFMGAWIETAIMDILRFADNVAPFMGAWIETLVIAFTLPVRAGCSLYGSMD